MRTLSTKTVVTDRDIQLRREEAHKAGDHNLYGLLQELLDWRRDGRLAVFAHDPTAYCNMGIFEIQCLAQDAGCEWWQCRDKATKIRTERQWGKGRFLCAHHAIEGEKQNLWSDSSNPNEFGSHDDDNATR